MSTLADELLQDFEDSGSEAEDGHRHDDADADAEPNLDRAGADDATSMDVDDQMSNPENEEGTEPGTATGQTIEDAQIAKAKVEKMQLGAVDDVRSVANLMQTLSPVLEVSFFQPNPHRNFPVSCAMFTSCHSKT